MLKVMRKIRSFGGGGHLDDAGGDSVLGSNPDRQSTKPYYQTLVFFLFFFF